VAVPVVPVAAADVVVDRAALLPNSNKFQMIHDPCSMIHEDEKWIMEHGSWII
jgi:hypothetical protein